MKIKYIRHGYYNCNYPPGSVVEVDDAYATYILGVGDAEKASPNDPITSPTPYVMKVRASPADDALTLIAQVLTQKDKQNAAGPERKA